MEIKTEPDDVSDEMELKYRRFNASDVANLECVTNDSSYEETTDKLDSSKQTIGVKPEKKIRPIQFEEVVIKSECFNNSDSEVVNEHNLKMVAPGRRAHKYTACDSFTDEGNPIFNGSDGFASSNEIIRIKPETNIEFEETVVKSECFDNSDSGVVNAYNLGDDKPFKCNLCDYRAAQSRYLKQHMRKHEIHKPFKCDECDYSSSFYWCLTVHMKKHTGDKIYKCNRCDYSTSLKVFLKVHMSTHKEEKRFKCGMCEYSGASPALLKSHMIKHTACKPFKCVMCDYDCARSSQLKLHMMVHSGQKPFNCAVCDFSSGKAGDLKVHMRKHTGEKPYRCTICKHTTARSDNLKLHMRTHAGQKKQSKG